MKSSFIILSFGMWLLSCTVLENRADCPSFLMIDFNSENNAVCSELNLQVSSPDGLFRYSDVIPRDRFADTLVLKVPTRGGVNIFAVDNDVSASFRQQGGGLLIPNGEDCPKAYLFASFCETDREENYKSVEIRKKFCGVALNFVSGDLQHYDMTVEGNVCGYDVDGNPVAGKFTFSPLPDSPNVCYFRLPRQTDSSLKLGISREGGDKRWFALGNYISQSGYDWTKPDLDDMVVRVDYAVTGITLQIGDWSTAVDFTVEI